MIELFVILSLLMTGMVVKRTGIFSPASIAALFTATSMVVYYVVSVMDVYRSIPSTGLGFILRDYHSVGLLTVTIYFFLMVVIWGSVQNLGVTTQAAGSGSLSETTRLLQRLLSPTTMTVIAFATGLFSILLALFISTLSDTSTLLSAVYKVALLICLLTSCLTVYCWLEKQYLASMILCVASIYFFQFDIAAYSRAGALTWFVITMLIANKRLALGKLPLTFATALCGFVGFWMYLFALQFRNYRHVNLDLSVQISQLAGVHFDSSYIWTTILNIFAGPMILSESLMMAPVTYPPKYMLLSFSPFPSFIDHFNNILNEQVRVNVITPFSSLGEVWFFGPKYIILYTVVYALSTRILTKVYVSTGPVYGFLLTAPSILGLVLLHQYPVRNSFRILLYTTLLSWFVSWWLAKRAARKLRVSEARPAASPGGLPPPRPARTGTAALSGAADAFGSAEH